MNEEIKERIIKEFRERDKENETLLEWTKALVKHMETKLGFSVFHNHIQRVLKSFIGMDGGIENKRKWAEVCATITGNEALWITSIGVYLTPEQIKENKL